MNCRGGTYRFGTLCMSIQLDLIEPYVTLVTGYSRVTLDIAAAVRTASATKINNFIIWRCRSGTYE